VLLALACAMRVGVAEGQASDECLMCHGNGAMFAGSRDSARLVVATPTLASSVHGPPGLTCVMCHQDVAFPHTEPPPVHCGSCHVTEDTQHHESLHGQASARGDPLAPGCTDCHGTHGVRSHLDPTSPTAVLNIPMLCGECHHEGTPVSRNRAIPQDRILENYSLSIHGEGLFRQGLSVSAVCTSCHTSHQILPHTDPRSSIHATNVAATCMQCHGQIEQVHRQVIEGRLWEEQPHLVPACVDCHAPHKIRRVFYDAGASDRDCLQCHADTELVAVAEGDTVSLYVDEEAYRGAMHGETACAQCHTEVTPGLRRPCSTIDGTVDCASCHDDQAGEWSSGIHGRLAAQGDEDAPVCLDCHDRHVTLGRHNPTSPTFPQNVPTLCAQCHRQGERAAVRILSDDTPRVESYEMSIHAKGLYESGLVVTATCSDCHTAHGELPAADSLSSVHHANVAETCGTCHHGIEERFRTSIHYDDDGLTDDGRELPSCEDCHTSHNISRVDRADFRLSTMTQCGRCHEDEAHTFFDTFHGKVSRLGDAGAAKCYDCHGTHGIHPISDPRSTLSRRHIVETCAQCHEGANLRFTGYLTHATHHDPEKYPWLFWTFWGMTALLVGTLAFATVHTLAWLYRLWRSPGVWTRHRPEPGEKVYERFTSFQRTMHLVMLLSFFTLALTGMMLKFSHMGWAQVSAGALGGFATTGVLHRLGAVTLIAIFLVHLWDVRRQKRASGRTWLQYISAPDSLVFNRRDLKEFVGSVRWFLGRGPRPRYGRYTYWEKFDYFAVFWGMFIIGSTGVLLWFPETSALVLPGWSVNVATILHSDEALLAVAFIFTVHFFNTHFRPDKFPMDPVIFTGQVPLEELKRDKPDEYEALVASGALDDRLVPAVPRKVERVVRVFAFTALAVGLVLIALIIYSMLSVYL
jgi:cytochrome b subunit of formate dehydrogenase